MRIAVAGHHQHWQATLAVAEIHADPLDHVAPAQLALQGHVGEHHVDLVGEPAQRFGGEQGEGLLGGDHVDHLQLLAFEHAPGRLGHHPAVLDVQHGRAGDALRLHVAADELGQCVVAQRLVEVVGDVFGEAALDQVLLGVAGDHDHRHVGLAGSLAHAARQFQAIAIGQRQRGGDQVDRALLQRRARLGDAGTADHLHARQLALEHVGDQLAHQPRTVGHHHPRRIADQVPQIAGRHQVSVGRVWRRKCPVTAQAPSQPSSTVPSRTKPECNASSPLSENWLP